MISSHMTQVTDYSSKKNRMVERKTQNQNPPLRSQDKQEGLINGSDIVGKSVLNPLTNSSHMILPAPFVNPNNGTGLVMSLKMF